jgi:hypothetical protein
VRPQGEALFKRMGDFKPPFLGAGAAPPELRMAQKFESYFFATHVFAGPND